LGVFKRDALIQVAIVSAPIVIALILALVLF
jgi:hypothetical protein